MPNMDEKLVDCSLRRDGEQNGANNLGAVEISVGLKTKRSAVSCRCTLLG